MNRFKRLTAPILIIIGLFSVTAITGDDNPRFKIQSLGGGPPWHASKSREEAYKAFMRRMKDHSWATHAVWPSMQNSIDLAWEAAMDILDKGETKPPIVRSIRIGSKCWTKVKDIAQKVVVERGPASDGNYLVREDFRSGVHADALFRTANELYFEETDKITE